MKYIILILTLLTACLQSAIAADTVTSAPYPYWFVLPEEIQDTILNTLYAQEAKVHGKVLTPADCTLLYKSYAAVQMVTMTQRAYRQWSKQVHDNLKTHVISLKHNLLMSLVDVDSKTILESLRKEKSPQLEDTEQNNLRCALEQLNDIVLTLEKPLSEKLFMRFLAGSSQLLFSEKPMCLIPNLGFIRNYYAPFMRNLIDNDDYDLLSFLTSHQWPLIMGDIVPPDHVKVLVEKSKANLPELRKVRDIVHKAYRYNIYRTGPYTYSTHLHSPESEPCAIL